jgi:hypothetical protein
MVISISVSISPKRGSSALSFKNNPTIPHIDASIVLSRTTLEIKSTEFNKKNLIFLSGK